MKHRDIYSGDFQSIMPKPIENPENNHKHHLEGPKIQFYNHDSYQSFSLRQLSKNTTQIEELSKETNT